jgi:HEAT repeat protein
MIQSQDEDRRQQLIAQNKEASKPVLADLSLAGFDVDWIEDLYNKRLHYQRAIPILLRWLPRVENPAIKEAIVRALSVPWARRTEAPVLLVEEFRKSKSDFGLNWAIGNALSVVADDNVLDDIVSLIWDKTYGKAREMLVVALGNMKSPDVKYTLIKLLDDEDLAGYAIMALGKLKCKEARPAIERFRTHPKSWVRREAKKALARIDKTIA